MAMMNSRKQPALAPNLWYKPWPYLLAAGIFGTLSGVLYWSSFNPNASFWASELCIDPWLTAKETAVLFTLLLVLAVSPSFRIAAISALAWIRNIGTSKVAQMKLSGTDGKHVWATLGYLRFLLAFIVLASHVDNVFFANKGTRWTEPVHAFGGFSAVLGFFVISGFSIASSINREASHYAKRRFFRIAPVYWLAFFFSFVPYLLFGWTLHLGGGATSQLPGISSLILNAAFLQTILVLPFDAFGQSWSLTAEIVYYTLAPWFNRLKLPALVFLAAFSSYCYLHHSGPGYYAEMYGRGILCLAWFWIAGFIFWKYRRFAWAAVLLVVPATLLTPADGVSSQPFGWIVVLVATLLLVSAGNIKLPQWAISLGNLAGGVSYPLYLLHRQMLYIAYCALTPHLARSISSVLGTVGCIILAWIVYALLDEPIQRWAKKTNTQSLPAKPAVETP